ncbi:hypothetical protein F4818DRAFT_411778 [Hypoxylon cercidicola]|nr:hypothetical protein F4818DRAFT_411778 [Hypoxylon cercidicola]
MSGVKSTDTATPTIATLLGPLTTSFIAPATCNISSLYMSTGFIIQGPLNTDDGCLPPKWVFNGYYSPGVCPSAYTNACSDTQNGIETTICCPTYQTFSCAQSIINDMFSCSQYIDNNPFNDFTVVAHSVQVRRAAQTGSALVIQRASKSAPTWGEFGDTSSDDNQGFDMDDDDMGDGRDDNRDGGRNNNNNNNNPGPQQATSTALALQPTLLPTSTHTEPESSSLPLSTQSKSMTPSLPAQVNPLSRSTIGGISGGIIGALLLGVFGTFIFMRRSRTRKTSRTPEPTSEPVLKVLPLTRTSMNIRHELDEQRNPSEMPSWDDHNPHGPSNPMVWELQGSDRFTTWELPA